MTMLSVRTVVVRARCSIRQRHGQRRFDGSMVGAHRHRSRRVVRRRIGLARVDERFGRLCCRDEG